MPVVIVVTGGIIAGAVYFAGGGCNKTNRAATTNAQEAAKTTPTPAEAAGVGGVWLVTEGDHTRGNSNAEITVIEHSDFFVSASIQLCSK